MNAAEAAKAEGIETVASGTDPWWRSCAERGIRELAAESFRTGQPFQSWDVGQRFGIPDPAEPRAWGALFLAAKNAGLIRHVAFARSKKATSHCAPVSEWVGTAKAVEEAA